MNTDETPKLIPGNIYKTVSGNVFVYLNSGVLWAYGRNVTVNLNSGVLWAYGRNVTVNYPEYLLNMLEDITEELINNFEYLNTLEDIKNSAKRFSRKTNLPSIEKKLNENAIKELQELIENF